MTTLELEPFSFPCWYPSFLDCSIEAISIPIPLDVQTYLKVGIFLLPKEALTSETMIPPANIRSKMYNTTTEDGSESIENPTFPVFSAKMTDALITLGGAVFLKLNWSCPKDAVWITANHTLKCTNLEEIYFLLKSSEIVDKDLSYEFKSDPTNSEPKHCVVLKRWLTIDLGNEFRLFIVGNKIVGISQRYCSNYYSYIEDAKDQIIEDIVNFFNNKVKSKFSVPTYSLDILRETRDSILIVDFNPLAQELTNLILFSWKEINVTPDHGTTSGTEPVNETDEDFSNTPVLNYVCSSTAFPSGNAPLSASSIHIDSVLKLNLKEKRFGVLRFVVPEKRITLPTNVKEDDHMPRLQVIQRPSISQSDDQQPPDSEEREIPVRRCRRPSDSCRR